jgi:putative transposase
MPNHFHFLIRIKSADELRQAFPKVGTLEKLPGKQFSNLFSSYTQAYNKKYSRMGSLFIKNFKRIKVTDQAYLLRLVRYIHFNPIEAGIKRALEDWPYSSYNSIVTNHPKSLSEEVISWFGDKENFLNFHSPFLKQEFLWQEQ